MTSILTNISKEYATQRFINLLNEPITKEKIEEVTNSIEEEFKKFKLTKRNLVFSILIPSVSSGMEQYISSVPYFSKFIKFYHHKELESKRRSPENSPRKMKMSRNSSIIMGSNIWVDLEKSEEEIEQ
jgi:hypothetical protein